MVVLVPSIIALSEVPETRGQGIAAPVRSAAE
jgi:hypothetical protein